MEKKVFNRNVLNATKWSTITQIIAKLIVPITNMILARLLAPEAFGVVATITMVISFADMFTDSGFQKYLVQNNFNNDEEKNNYATVAFWTNLVISLLIWFIIIIFSNQIALLVGGPGLGSVFIIAGISLPITSFSSIQMALYRRNLDFKTLFFVRIFAIFIPFFITIPLAVVGFSYWSIIIGTIVGNISNAIILTIKSPWRPRIYFSFIILKNMISYSIWSLAESIASWSISWIGTFLVGQNLSTYYLGIYKTSISTVNGITGVVTESTSSVLFSTLSKLNNDREEFKKVFLNFQKFSGYVLLPLGIGIYIYRDFITQIFLGNQWTEASFFVGLWGISSTVSVVFGQYCMEVYRSLGKPRIALIVQVLHLVFLIPTLIIASQYNFNTLVYSRCLIRIQYILLNLTFVYWLLKITPIEMFKNLISPTIASAIMSIVAYILIDLKSGIFWSFVSIAICIIIYSSVMLFFNENRKILLSLIKIGHNNMKFKFQKIVKP